MGTLLLGGMKRADDAPLDRRARVVVRHELRRAAEARQEFLDDDVQEFDEPVADSA